MKAAEKTAATFHKKKFKSICDALSQNDKHLHAIIQQYGYPPMWKREPSFATLVHIILEQQVSLASAKAAFLKLEEKIKIITPKNLLALTDEELKACYFSRQKIIYARDLAVKVLNKELIIENLSSLSNDEVSHQLKKVKGIGEWTANVFLMFALQRTDCFAHGDIALIASIKELKNKGNHISYEQLVKVSNKWKPYRTVACFILWHHYLSKRNRTG